jgi:hypothetical protein
METKKELYKIFKSTVKHKKYSVYVKGDNGKPKLIHFGQLGYDQFRDTTPLKLYSNLDHNDEERRRLYLLRAKGIKKDGKISWKDKNSANYYAVKYLWSG